jgi:hypothetical protein
MKVSNRRFEYLTKGQENIRSWVALLEHRVQRIILIGIMLIIISVGWNLFLLKKVQKTLSGKTATPLKVEGYSLTRNMSAKYLQEKYLAHILEISCPVGVFSVTSSGIPATKAPSLTSVGVSALTKGAIVSKFLGYLYSKGGSKDAEVIECDYSFPERAKGSFHFDFLERALTSWGFSYSPVRSGDYRFTKNDVPRNECWACCLILAVRTPDPQPVDWNPQPLSGTMRHVLMMTASSTPSQGILVSLKQADEALRKGRNTSAQIDEGEQSQI